MEYVRRLVEEGRTEVTRISDWTQQEVEAHRERIGEYISEMRPRKRMRRQDDPRQLSSASNSRGMTRQTPAPTQTYPRELRRSPAYELVEPTAAPSLEDVRARDLVLDSLVPPSMGQTFSLTGETLPASIQAVGTAPAEHASSTAVVNVTAAPSAAPQQQSGGMNSTTQAIIIAASIAGVIVLVSAIVLFSICYRRKKRRSVQGHALKNVPNRTKSTSTVQSDSWRSESSEVEKQALIRGHSASRSPSPASRSQHQHTNTQSRSLGLYNPRLPQIPESPLVNIADQPTSPTSIYTKALSPPQPTGPGQLQVDMPLSPLRPPPLRLTSRRGSEAPGTAMIPSPKNPFASVRIPFFSGTPSNADKRRSSMARSMSSAGYDEERGISQSNRRTVESDTLPKQSGYRDSLWSVAASSFWGGSSSKWKSTYSEWNAVPSSTALSHTRSTSTSGQSTIDTGFSSDAASATHSRARSHSSVYSARRPSGALIPALPPMPSAQQLQQQYGHKTSMSNASEGSMAEGDVQFKGRLHSVDFWAREEREMRLGTFEPAELDGSPSPSVAAPPPLGGASTPRDVHVEAGEAVTSDQAGRDFASQPQETMSRGRLGADPYSNGLGGPSGYGVTGGMQGGYSVNVSGGNSPPMPQGYTQESDNGRRLWGRSRSRSASRGRSSASTVATVFRQHPGDMVMI